MKQDKEKIFEALRTKTEKTFGRKISSPRDFDHLSSCILECVKLYVSPMTLKRFWGYLGDKRKTNPYQFTLNTLSQYCGYADIDSFAKASDKNIESEFIENKHLLTTSITKGAHIRLFWHPDRCVTIRYEGMEMFTILESINSKLAVGDTFFCNQFIDREALVLRCLVHKNSQPTNYICGKINGIKFNILPKEP